MSEIASPTALRRDRPSLRGDLGADEITEVCKLLLSLEEGCDTTEVLGLVLVTEVVRTMSELYFKLFLWEWDDDSLVDEGVWNNGGTGVVNREEVDGGWVLLLETPPNNADE